MNFNRIASLATDALHMASGLRDVATISRSGLDDQTVNGLFTTRYELADMGGLQVTTSVKKPVFRLRLDDCAWEVRQRDRLDLAGGNYQVERILRDGHGHAELYLVKADL